MNETLIPGAVEQEPTQRKSHSILVLVVVLVILSALGLGAYYLTLQNRLADFQTKYGTFDDYYTATLAENPDYAAAEEATRLREYERALPLYRAALTQAADIVQETQIKYMIAITTSRTGDYLSAIPLYKEAAANDSSDATRLIRANAVQTMANLYGIFGDQKIITEVFKDEPYASLQVKNDTNVSLLRLTQYAASIYPLAESEFKIASWYAARLLQSKTVDDSAFKLTETETAEYEEAMHQAFNLGETDMERLDGGEYTDYAITRGELPRAITLGMMNRYGDESAGSADDAFKQAMDHFAQFGPGHDAIVRYHYAAHLALLPGVTQTANVRALLAPFYSDPAYGASIAGLLRNSRRDAGQKNMAVAVAAEDPKFKAFLIALDWTESDFSK